MDRPPEHYQARFARAWSTLSNPHVRALAWLLDAPGLLDPAHPHWHGKVATLPEPDEALRSWLHSLDADPAPLLASLGDKAYTRLGLYAEKLIAFHFQAQGRLLAHGLQVRAARNDTVGEFDFLLDAGDGKALHIEFATKFYLLEGAWPDQLDSLVGPNLADSLGQKMRKITSQQLALASHPAAQAVLPCPVVRAQALVKGWLFYPRGTVSGIEGLDPQHCRGTWCSAEELEQLEGESFIQLARMQWLAPARTVDAAQVLSRAALAERVADYFAGPAMPMLVASVREEAGVWTECERAFVVPGDWRARAASRRTG